MPSASVSALAGLLKVALMLGLRDTVLSSARGWVETTAKSASARESPPLTVKENLR
jgi:hypothetical protein